MILTQWREFVEGKKKQTRRVVVDEPIDYGMSWKHEEKEGDAVVLLTDFPGTDWPPTRRVKYRIGGEYAVTPKRGTRRVMYHGGLNEYSPDGADAEYFSHHGIHWLGAMRRDGWLELRLRIQDIRRERLQDISVQDAIDEGVRSGDYTKESLPGLTHWGKSWSPIVYLDYQTGEWHGGHFMTDLCACGTHPAVCSYKSLWQKINGKRAACRWEDNPLVWVYVIEPICV